MIGFKNFKNRAAVALVAVAAATAMAGCSSEAHPAELTPMQASALIAQRWSQDELNHFKVVLHSDTLVECGVANDLWKLGELTDRGYTRTAYQLTEKGSRVLFGIDLSDSGKNHQITLRGPYRLDITQIVPAPQPDSRYVMFHWEIDWAKASSELKACVPKFEMSGNEVALFQVDNLNWKFISYLNPDDAAAVQAANPVQ